MYENEIQSIAARESDAEIYAGLLQLTKDIAKQKGCLLYTSRCV